MKQWLKATAIKAVKTMAQTALGTIGGTVMITGVNWGIVASASAMAGVWCVLMNLANLEEE